MSSSRFSFEEKKFILKCYWKYENIAEVQRRFIEHFSKAPPSRPTIARIRDKFEQDGTVHDLHKEHSGRPRTSTDAAGEAAVLEAFQRSPKKSLRRAACETGISRNSIHRILKARKWKCYIPRLVQHLEEDDLGRRREFCQWFLAKCEQESRFPRTILWSDEAKFKLNGEVNRHNCCYWATENPHFTLKHQLNVPGVTVWCGFCATGIIGPFFFEGTMTGADYLELLKNSVVERARDMFVDDNFYFQQDGAPPHYHREVTSFLHENFPNRWIGRRGSVEYPPRSPDLTPLDFFLWGYLKDKVYGRKPKTIEELKNAIKEECLGVPYNLFEDVCDSVKQRCEKCLQESGRQFEHM